jgi:hypothetical protein
VTTDHVSLWESILARAGAERALVDAGESTVRRDELEVEMTPFGRLRWYLHHDLTLPVTRALYFCELELPPGSRSGVLRHQGGIVHFVAEGSGYTTLDGAEHAWEQRDVIALPIRPEGVTFQHVNTGTGAARLVLAWPNLDSALGPEGGVAMEVLEPASDHPGPASPEPR